MPGSHPAPPSTAPLTLGPADILRVLAEHVDAEPDRAERAAIAAHLRALADTLPVLR